MKSQKYYYLWKYQNRIFEYLGRYDDGLKSINYDQAISINPNCVEACFHRGSMKYDLGQKQAAIIDYDRAIIINYNYTVAYNNRGNARSDLGQKQAAILDFYRAIIINPNYAEAYASRCIVKFTLGQKQAAIADLTRAANLFRQQNRMGLYQKAIRLIQKIEKQRMIE